jgi:hypothetical protein
MAVDIWRGQAFDVVQAGDAGKPTQSLPGESRKTQ